MGTQILGHKIYDDCGILKSYKISEGASDMFQGRRSGSGKGVASVVATVFCVFLWLNSKLARVN